ncbi:MAG TPA: hypothetical protein VE326_14845 [Candidatus Binatia bacterium]|nr:hypothetical protein [Candidatus Binatia bacterium]
MLRLILRLWLTLLLFFLGRLFGQRSRGGTFGAPGDDPGPLPGHVGGSRRPGSRRARAPGSMPPLDRSDVVDVPFTEIPPPTDAARGAAGGP